MKIQKIIEHGNDVYTVIVETKKATCYYNTWNGWKPTEEEVRESWRDDRKNFLPWIAGQSQIGGINNEQ